MMRFLVLGFLLVGCTPEVIRTPGPVVYRDRIVIQPIPEALTAPLPIAEGSPSQCFDVAAARKEQLLVCNKDRKTLRDRPVDDNPDRQPD